MLNADHRCDDHFRDKFGKLLFYFIGGAGADANWATAANWSGGVAPGNGASVIFDGTCVSNCSPTLAVNTTVAVVRINPGYAGTITQAAGKTLTVSTNWVQQAGTFVGGNSAITFNGGYYISAGTYTASSATTTFAGSYIVSGTPILTLTSSTYSFNGTGTVTTGSETYNNVTFAGWATNITIGGTLTVAGTLTCSALARNTLNTGTILVQGNILLLNQGITGTALVKVAGSANQSVDASGTAEGTL